VRGQPLRQLVACLPPLLRDTVRESLIPGQNEESTRRPAQALWELGYIE
jgi:hypothetical protein